MLYFWGNKIPLDQYKPDRQKLFLALLFPSLFLFLLWLIKIIEVTGHYNLSEYGLYPLEAKGIKGILFFPLIHSSLEHLINNSTPLFILSATLFYFYRPISYKVFLLIYFIHGIWLWFFARDGCHIGASGLIYGLGAFLFTSGIIRKNTNLLAISLMVAFLYGSMVWGIFPLKESISWEGHLTGLASGIIFAFFYKDFGPKPNFGQWEKEMPDDGNEPDDDNPYWNVPLEEEKPDP
ncbi:MAG: rhomboid family intramembrane serine protease [Bacteroidales bacterium]|nr:rhomboid family intramembrane serine protease [Bacteroidales bacterium]